MALSDLIKKISSFFSSSEGQKLKNELKKQTKTFTFESLPTTLAELQALPEAKLDDPFKAAALTVLALNAYAANADAGAEMLNFLKGPKPLTPADKQFLRDRFMDGKTYVPISYFAGTSPDNNYTPAQPYKLTINDNPYSYQDAGYATLWLTSSGADSQRQVKLRKKESTGEWFLWEQYLLPDIRQPKAADPWA